MSCLATGVGFVKRDFWDGGPLMEFVEPLDRQKGRFLLKIYKISIRNIHIFTSEWLGGLHIGVPMLGAPIATWIYYKLGTIRTVMIGILGVSMCFALTAMSINIGE